MNKDVFSNHKTKEAWIVFTGHADLWWLKILKPEFRHCYALLNDGQRWMSVDPLSTFTDIQIYHNIKPNFDLPQWLEEQGYKVIKAKIYDHVKKPAPWMFLTCVETIKRILGIHKRFIFTPWQLYCFLKNQTQQRNYNIRKEISYG
jgi:hypothetical protein